jgi:hypothetical protein
MDMTMLDNISTAIEKVVKDLRAPAAPITRKRMPLDKFVAYALAQITKAAEEKPRLAKRRLAALKRSVDGVIATVAKMIAEDTESQSIKVEVETAFAPTKDTPIDGLTTAADQSSTEMSMVGSSQATGGSVFAAKMKAVAKTLNKLKADLDGAPGGRPRKPTQKSDAAGGKDRGADGDAGDGDRTGDGWPMDLNTAAFLTGDRDAETKLTWGVDPDEVASPKTR